MDNCPVMRGARSRVEQRIKRVHDSLLDVDGDCVHKETNAAKGLLAPFQVYLEGVCRDLEYDIEQSPKVSDLFGDIQQLLGLECSAKNASGIVHLLRFCPSRFLNMLTIAERVYCLMDALTVYHYAFLSQEEKDKPRYKNLVEDLSWLQFCFDFRV